MGGRLASLPPGGVCQEGRRALDGLTRWRLWEGGCCPLGGLLLQDISCIADPPVCCCGCCCPLQAAEGGREALLAATLGWALPPPSSFCSPLGRKLYLPARLCLVFLGLLRGGGEGRREGRRERPCPPPAAPPCRDAAHQSPSGGGRAKRGVGEPPGRKGSEEETFPTSESCGAPSLEGVKQSWTAPCLGGSEESCLAWEGSKRP